MATYQQTMISPQGQALPDLGRQRRDTAYIKDYTAAQEANLPSFRQYIVGRYMSQYFMCDDSILLAVDENGLAVLPGPDMFILPPWEAWLPVDPTERRLLFYKCQRVTIGYAYPGNVWSAAFGVDLRLAQENRVFGPDGYQVAQDSGYVLRPLIEDQRCWVQHPDGIWELMNDFVISDLQLHWHVGDQIVPMGRFGMPLPGLALVPALEPVPILAPALAPTNYQVGGIQSQDDDQQVVNPASPASSSASSSSSPATPLPHNMPTLPASDLQLDIADFLENWTNPTAVLGVAHEKDVCDDFADYEAWAASLPSS